MTIAEERRATGTWPIVGPPIYEGTRIPANIPTILEVPHELRNLDDILQVNFGPKLMVSTSPVARSASVTSRIVGTRSGMRVPS